MKDSSHITLTVFIFFLAILFKMANDERREAERLEKACPEKCHCLCHE